MKLPRSIGLVDLAVLTVVLVMIVLPPRRMYAASAHKADEAAQFALALAEARTIANPKDGARSGELARQLGDAGFKDWAIETAVAGAERAKGTPDEWRALLATSVAYVDHLDVVPALDYATRALTECRAIRCPTWEEVRMQLYEQHLGAGVKSGIDPKKDPKGFRAAGQNALPMVHLNTGSREQEQPAVAPADAGSTNP